VFERFDEPAHRILGVAYLQARRSGHEAIGLEHLLIGLAEEAPHLLGRPPHVLRPSSVDMDQDREDDDRYIPFTADALAVLEQAIAEADALHQQAVVPAHLVLALVRDPAARRLLEARGLSPDELQQAAVSDSLPSPPVRR
jgi:ATP-dependent Clp protease ATP-binding subunit ClpC